MAERRIEWTDAARDDLHAIAFYIAQDSLDNALHVVDRIERRATALAALATRGRIVPELRRMTELRYREVIERPWRIIYRAEGTVVHIAAVVDGHRDVQAWLNERAARFKRVGR